MSLMLFQKISYWDIFLVYSLMQIVNLPFYLYGDENVVFLALKASNLNNKNFPDALSGLLRTPTALSDFVICSVEIFLMGATFCPTF